VKLERFIAVLVAGLAVQSLIALGQTVLQRPIGLPGELAPWPTAPGASTINLRSHLWLRAYGLTFHPNVLAGFLTVGLILTLPLLDRRWSRLAWWLMSLALLATFSRSAVLAIALVLPPTALWLWRHDRRLRRGLMITLGIAVCAVSLIGWVWRASILARIGIDTSKRPAANVTRVLDRLKTDERVALNRAAVRVIAAHPLLGIGAGNSPLAMQRAGESPHFPHNVALMLAAEVGVAGGLLWIALARAAVWRLRRPATSRAGPWLVAGVGAFAALQIIGLLDCYPWSLNAGRMLTVVVLATIEKAASASEPAALDGSPTPGGCPFDAHDHKAPAVRPGPIAA
jgi:O-antigen ligase